MVLLRCRGKPVKEVIYLPQNKASNVKEVRSTSPVERPPSAGFSSLDAVSLEDSWPCSSDSMWSVTRYVIVTRVGIACLRQLLELQSALGHRFRAPTTCILSILQHTVPLDE